MSEFSIKTSYKKILTLFLLLIFPFSIFSENLKKSDEPYYAISNFNIYAEEPMIYFENGETVVVAPDIEIVNQILKLINSNDTIEILPWDISYQKTLTDSNAVLISTALTPERKKLFKWAGPIGTVDNSMFALKDSNFKIKNFEDLKKIQSIGVLKDYFNEQALKNAGFTNLVYVKDDYDGIHKLFNKEISLYASNSYAFPIFMKILNKKMNDVQKVFTSNTALLYVAFNINTPDETINLWQEKIDYLKKTGEFHEFYRKAYPDYNYFAPDILQLVTEDYPPITFEKDGKITGLATEVVEEIIKKLGIPNNIKLMYWDDAYQLALINPNVVLFSTTRTEKRENLFHWLGPIGSYNDNLYSKKDSNIKISSLEEAKKLKSIGTVNGWFSQELLLKENFQNLTKTPDPVEYRK